MAVTQWVTYVILLFHGLDSLPRKESIKGNRIQVNASKLSKTHHLLKKAKTTFINKHSLISKGTKIFPENSDVNQNKHRSEKYNKTITNRQGLLSKHLITVHRLKQNKTVEKNRNHTIAGIHNILQTQTPDTVLGEKRHSFHHYYHPIHHFRHKLRHFHHHFRDDDYEDDFDDEDGDDEFFRPRISPVESINDHIEPIDRIGGIERIDPMEGIEPIDRIEPIERIQDIEPVEPIEQGERTESMVPMKSIEEEDGATKSHIPKQNNNTKAHRRHFPHHNHTIFAAHVEDLPIKRNPNDELNVTANRVLMLPSGTAVINIDGYHNHHGIAGAPGALGVLHPATGATGAEYSAKGAVDSRVGVVDPAKGVIHPATGVTDPAQGITKEATKATGAGPNTKLEKGVKLKPNEGFKKENIQESITNIDSEKSKNQTSLVNNSSIQSSNLMKVNGLNLSLDANSMKNVLEVTKSLGISINQTNNTNVSFENPQITNTAQRTLSRSDGNIANNILELTRSLGISINQTNDTNASHQDRHVSKNNTREQWDGNASNNILELTRSLNIPFDPTNHLSSVNNTAIHHKNLTTEDILRGTDRGTTSANIIRHQLNNSNVFAKSSTGNVYTKKPSVMNPLTDKEKQTNKPSTFLGQTASMINNTSNIESNSKQSAKNVLDHGTRPFAGNGGNLNNVSGREYSRIKNTFLNAELDSKQSTKHLVVGDSSNISNSDNSTKLSFVVSGNVSETNYQYFNKTTTEGVGSTGGDRRGIVIPGPAIPSIEMEPVEKPEKIKDIELDKTEIPMQDAAGELAKTQQKIPDIEPIDVGQLDSRLIKEVIEPIKKPQLLQVDIEKIPPIEPIPPIADMPPIEK